ncbi:uncharacterized protein CHSO_3405 [Chryseobacterium sp. StRB126]|uniref:hypothetical protein n=1 Tax=Chryseobacterium sp. StRB126 TaxID=878220 RepID=UPI0004E9993C|nr:hypothetical protein [Chryseobacterium sp. StRB126]BAP32442.1 uncharacterized protein CHSO_3405 [Chryseobacterium sp. StRB126]
MKNKKQPDYQRIFTDIIDCKYPDKKEICSRLLKKEILSTLDVLKLNELIFGQETKEVVKFNQSHKVYDKNTIHYILKYQKENTLSDSHIAIRFKLSRCTIAKWKKENK